MRTFLAVVFALPVLSGSAFGWSCAAHQTITLIARTHLTPEVSAAVDSLLRNNPIDPALKRLCKDRAADLMADAATWADDVRPIKKNDAWHFMNVPLAFPPTTTFDVMRWCQPLSPATGTAPAGQINCIIDALQHEWTILQQNTAQPPAQADALRYVIHFIEDIHQPLHTTDNNDEGGNCTVMTFFSEKPPTTLHSIWDTRIIQREMAAKNLTPQSFAEELDRRFADRWNDWGTSKARMADWVRESHKIAVDVTYGALKPAIPVEAHAEPTDETAACNAEKARVAALHIDVSQPYFDRSLPVIEEQMAKAAYRLAAILNQTFK